LSTNNHKPNATAGYSRRQTPSTDCLRVYGLILSLPFPPTGNHSVKHGGGRHYSTQEVKTYRSKVAALVQATEAELMSCSEYMAPLAVTCEVFPPDNRRRDLDNTWKTLADALTHANVWQDDSQIIDLHLVRGEVRQGGQVVVSISEVEE